MSSLTEMETEKEIVNKVASSPLVTINLEAFIPEGDRVILDIKDQLFQGLILREKDFRDFIANNEWAKYENKFVAITCSADAIVPIWAYMLIASKLVGIAAHFVFGNIETLEIDLFKQEIAKHNFEQYQNKPIVVKGCFDRYTPVYAYTEITRLLQPYAKSIMYGEPCSTVPIFKQKSGK